MNEIPKVLVVDDIESNRLIFERILSSVYCDVVLAVSGQDALAKLEKDHFSLVLMDIKMPGLSGIETFERIRRKPAWGKLPIIFISASFEDSCYKLKGVEQGLVAFLEKPIIPQVLQGKVNTYLKLEALKKKLEESSEEKENDFSASIKTAREKQRQLTSSDQKRKKILLVEDDSDVRTVMSFHLETYFDTLAAENVNEALLKLNQESIDLILSDLDLPEVDGVEFAKWLQKEGLSIPVILISGQHQEFISERIKDIEEIYFFSKPVDYAQLIAMIKKLLKPR